MTERWRQVPGYEGAYEVSSHGRVRSVDRIMKAFRNYVEMVAAGYGQKT
jgi:hypothetical protein